MSDIKWTDEELLRELFNGYDEMDEEDRAIYYQYLEELRSRIGKLKISLATSNQAHHTMARGYRKLLSVLKDIAMLTVDHDVLNDRAVVYPSKLGAALEKYDPDWVRSLVKARG